MTTISARLLSRRIILPATAGLALLAAACGSDDSGTPTATNTSSPAESSTSAPSATVDATVAAASPTAATVEALRLVPRPPTEMGAPAVPEAAAPSAPDARSFAAISAPYADFGTDAAPGVFPRTVRHAMGETELATRPERIVVLNSTELNAIIELGIQPVGYADTGAALPPAIQAGLGDARNVGRIGEPDLEAIAVLQPDLILSNRAVSEAVYDRLTEIAPVVFGSEGGIVWQLNFELYAQAVGREAEAAETVAAYEARVAELNAKLPSPRPEVSLLRVRANGVRYYLRNNFSATVLTDLGFPRPATQNIDAVEVTMPLESLGEYASNGVVVVGIDGGNDSELGKSFFGNGVWQALPSVLAGDVMEVDNALWYGATGYGGAHEVMDEIAAFFEIE